jgi:hypothetical protein
LCPLWKNDSCPKAVVRKRSKANTQLCIDILTWFVQQSGHPGYRNTSIPDDCPQPLLVKDHDSTNNTDESVDTNVESNYESGTYSFSTAQNPSVNASIYSSSDKFALALLQRSAPHLLVYGGTYANNVEMNVENILLFAFPFGIGGPRMKQWVKASLLLCIQLYMCLSLCQFMEGPTVLVRNHIYNRQMSYQTGVMTCRSNVDGHLLGEKLSTLSISDFEKVNDNNTDRLDATTKGFVKAISTSCRAVGHSEEVAKFARQCMFAMLDYYGLNSLFLRMTPDNECSFRVRLYCKPLVWVSSLLHL